MVRRLLPISTAQCVEWAPAEAKLVCEGFAPKTSHAGRIGFLAIVPKSRLQAELRVEFRPKSWHAIFFKAELVFDLCPLYFWDANFNQWALKFASSSAQFLSFSFLLSPLFVLPFCFSAYRLALSAGKLATQRFQTRHEHACMRECVCGMPLRYHLYARARAQQQDPA